MDDEERDPFARLRRKAKIVRLADLHIPLIRCRNVE